MTHPPTPDGDVVLSYSTEDTRKPFSAFAFLAGLSTPYAYATLAMCRMGMVTSKRSAFEAFYSFDPEVVLGIALFPVIVFMIWRTQRRSRYRGFIEGVVTGLLVLPVLAMVAVGIAFRHP